MRKTFALLLMFGLTTAVGAQYKKPTKTSTPNAPGSPVKMTPGISEEAVKNVKRISIDEAKELVDEGKGVFFDVRSREQFEQGHITGALSVPGSQILAGLKQVAPGKMVITYCACSAEQSSGRAVVDLQAHGFKNAAALTGGYNSWKAMGLPVSTGAK